MIALDTTPLFVFVGAAVTKKQRLVLCKLFETHHLGTELIGYLRIEPRVIDRDRGLERSQKTAAFLSDRAKSDKSDTLPVKREVGLRVVIQPVFLPQAEELVLLHKPARPGKSHRDRHLRDRATHSRTGGKHIDAPREAGRIIDGVWKSPIKLYDGAQLRRALQLSRVHDRQGGKVERRVGERFPSEGLGHRLLLRPDQVA